MSAAFVNVPYVYYFIFLVLCLENIQFNIFSLRVYLSLLFVFLCVCDVIKKVELSSYFCPFHLVPHRTTIPSHILHI